MIILNFIKKEYKFTLVSILVFTVILLIGSSYALLRSSSRGTNQYVMSVGTLEVSFKSGTQELTLNNAYPISDEEGLEQDDELVFTIKNTGNIAVNYNLYIDEISKNPEFKTVIKYVDKKGTGEYSNIKVLSDDKYIDSIGYIEAGEEITYKVKCWLDYDADSTYMNKVFSARIVVEASQYREATFLPGPEFNIKIKELAGTDTSTNTNGYQVVDSNIIYIKRAKELPNNITFTDDNILSTSDSQEPIYGWFDNGTLYYYTFAKNPYMNSDSSHMYGRLSKVESIDTITINTSNVTNMQNMFEGNNSIRKLDLSNFETNHVKNMNGIFYGCSLLESLNINNFNTTQVSNMAYMFYNCISLSTLDLTSFDTTQVSNMAYMFYNCISLSTLDLTSFDTSKVGYMNFMFSGSWQAYMSLKEIKGIEKFVTTNVITMESMFYNCSNLESLDLSNWNTSNVNNMYLMFHGMKKLTTININNFDTSKVQNMRLMFYGCSSLKKLDISSFTMTNVSNLTEMLSAMPSLVELKTPKVYPNNLSITLPKTLYDDSHNAYTTLDSSSPTSIWLKSE